MSTIPREKFEELYKRVLGDETEEDPVRWKKRMRILRAATELFIRQGYKKTSVEEIAKRAEVAKGTVYLYFPTKGQILFQAVALEKRAMFDVLAPVLDGTLPEEQRLHYLIRASLEAMVDLPLVSRVVRDDSELMAALQEASNEAVVAESLSTGEQFLAEMIEMAAPGVFDDAEKKERAQLILHARYFTSVMAERPLVPGIDLRELAKTLADVVVHGLVHRPPEDE